MTRARTQTACRASVEAETFDGINRAIDRLQSHATPATRFLHANKGWCDEMRRLRESNYEN